MYNYKDFQNNGKITKDRNELNHPLDYLLEQLLSNSFTLSHNYK